MAKKHWEYESVKKYKAAYDATTTVHISLKFNKNTDEDILEKLSEVENKQAYIKQLIRADISKEKTRE